MASIQRSGARWRVQLYVNGQRESASFDTKAEAAAWALQREAELTGKRLPYATLRDAIERYGRERIPPSPSAAEWQATKLRHLARYPLVDRPLSTLTRTDFAAWRDARLKEAKRGGGTIAPSTVNRELNLLSAVLRECCGDFGLLRDNPMRGLGRPTDPPSRRRRITDAEIAAMVQALGYDGTAPETPAQRVAVAFLLAIETGMRGGEIVRIRPSHVRGRVVHIPHSKNGDARDVPLSPKAQQLLDQVGGHFHLTDRERDYLFRYFRDKAGIVNLHFHDARSEAVWRLSKKFDVLELARVIGHRDIKSLLFYYQTTADELAARLA